MVTANSLNLRRSDPKVARCSRLFFAEHDLIDRSSAELVCSIYSTHQHLDAELKPRDRTGIQTFAVLWDRAGIETAIFKTIELAIIWKVIAPVQVIHFSEGTLTIVLASSSLTSIGTSFWELWQIVTMNSHWDDWIFNYVYANDITPITEGRLLRKYTKGVIATEELGIVDYGDEHRLFTEEFPEESLPQQEDSQSEFDFSDDDLLL
jgi:hypothetical protein